MYCSEGAAKYDILIVSRHILHEAVARPKRLLLRTDKTALAPPGPDGEGPNPTRSSERVERSRPIPGTTLVHGSGMG